MTVEWRRTWADIPFTGGAYGVEIVPPDGDGWELVQTIHVPPSPELRPQRLGSVRLGSLVHVWQARRTRPDPAVARDILEALCRRGGLSLDSDVEPGRPARNYELALRLGIGEVFGV